MLAFLPALERPCHHSQTQIEITTDNTGRPASEKEFCVVCGRHRSRRIAQYGFGPWEAWIEGWG
jgi:hypothetical protein